MIVAAILLAAQAAPASLWHVVDEVDPANHGVTHFAELRGARQTFLRIRCIPISGRAAYDIVVHGPTYLGNSTSGTVKLRFGWSAPQSRTWAYHNDTVFSTGGSEGETVRQIRAGSSQLVVRLQRYDDYVVDVFFDIRGADPAIAELERRCQTGSR
jgi:hypothetical protein